MQNLIASNYTCSIEVANNFTSLYTRELGYETKRSYVAIIKEFFEYEDIKDIPISKIISVTPEDANFYAISLLENGYAKHTINKKLGALFNFYQFLCRRSIHICEYNPFSTSEGCIRLKNAQSRYSNRRCLLPSEIIKIIECVQTPNDSDKSNKNLTLHRDRLVLELLSTTGCRRSELASMTLTDITYNMNKWVIEIIGKGEKKRLMVIPEKVKKHLDTYVMLRGVSYSDCNMPVITKHRNYIEPNQKVATEVIYRVVRKYALKSHLLDSGNGNISPHCFRHSYCTNSLDMGAELSLVSECMGHAFITTTMRYSHSMRLIALSPNERLAEMYSIK